MSNGPVGDPPPLSNITYPLLIPRRRSDLMAPDEFKNLGFQDGAKEKNNDTKPGSRLEELKKENAALLKKHAVEKKQ